MQEKWLSAEYLGQEVDIAQSLSKKMSDIRALSAGSRTITIEPSSDVDFKISVRLGKLLSSKQEAAKFFLPRKTASIDYTQLTNVILDPVLKDRRD